ncbi:hypothetical protein [endosymbiont of Ridgeia piscesae]|uniref:Uncharacterized protein n=1 Tax=endosymbiont of Ridgeia piscesae TaxID=54398 RepID=A0A0T5ZBY5_9GAMM|nr:hypothetical protein [endosymbiont of Ridgeia piscesae]KRT55292.1 hypothetical protein Ga0074115_11650 [endosymbiont of Ridgeia piscesae]KRT60038.1 hypothetical protein Ga0076813_16473 [endosymbiont of Ridgeia piscesae]
MKLRKSLLFGALFLQGMLQAHAISDAKLEVIRELGRLNGIALQCGYLEQTQRMKRALVLRLPKLRQLGELFDVTANKSFMELIERGENCPSAGTLADQVGSAIDSLEREYPSSERR